MTVVSVSTVGDTNMYTVSDDEPRYYGRRQIKLDPKPNSQYIEACIEFKCEGKVYTNVRDLTSVKTDKTNVTIDVQGQRCCIKARHEIFSIPGEDGIQSNINIGKALPVWFIDSEHRGQYIYERGKLQPSASCKNEKSPQNTDTVYCQNTDKEFNSAFDVVCDSSCL